MASLTKTNLSQKMVAMLSRSGLRPLDALAELRSSYKRWNNRVRNQLTKQCSLSNTPTNKLPSYHIFGMPTNTTAGQENQRDGDNLESVEVDMEVDEARVPYPEQTLVALNFVGLAAK